MSRPNHRRGRGQARLRQPRAADGGRARLHLHAGLGRDVDPPTAEGAFGLYIRGTETTREGPTDDTGQAAFGNLLPGSFTVTMRNKSGELGRATARIRAGWVSGIFVFPAPIPDGSL